MEINQITEFIIAAAPAVTAIISVVVALIVGIKNIKAAGEKTVADVRESNSKIVAANIELQKENAELKKEIRTAIAAVKKIKDDKGK